jgi:hypothetical protein
LVHELSRKQPKTTKELLDIATWHTSGEVAVGANDGWAAPTKATAKGAKDEKKGQKRLPHRIDMMANNGNDDEGANNPSEESIAVVEHDFKQQT